MRLEQLQQIIVIEKERSISKAAKALFVSQPTLSASLSGLEQEIGVKIFERTANGVAVTREGEDILVLAKQVCNNCNQILNYRSKDRELTGEVTLAITHAYSYLFADLLLAFKERFPKAGLDLRIEIPDEIIEEIARGAANIGLTLWQITPEQTHEFLKRKGVNFETFGRHTIMLYAHKDNPFAARESVAFAELSGQRFVVENMGRWHDISLQAKPTQPPLIMSDRENLKRLIAEGVAVAVMPETYAFNDFYCQQGLIKLVPMMTPEGLSQGVDHLLYPARRELSLLEQGTLAVCREVLRATGPRKNDLVP